MSAKGIPTPTQQGMIGSSPGNSSYLGLQSNTDSLMALRSVGGNRTKRRKSRRIKGGSGIAVPLLKPSYTSANGTNQDVVSQQTDLAKISSQSAANSEFDSKAAITTGGGKRMRKRKGTMKNRKTKGRKSNKSSKSKRRYRR